LVLLIIAYTLSPTKLEIRAKGGRGKGVRERAGGGERNDPNIVCIYE
jgi:hypothetical protein